MIMVVADLGAQDRTPLTLGRKFIILMLCSNSRLKPSPCTLGLPTGDLRNPGSATVIITQFKIYSF